MNDLILSLLSLYQEYIYPVKTAKSNILINFFSDEMCNLLRQQYFSVDMTKILAHQHSSR